MLNDERRTGGAHSGFEGRLQRRGRHGDVCRRPWRPWTWRIVPSVFKGRCWVSLWTYSSLLADPHPQCRGGLQFRR